MAAHDDGVYPPPASLAAKAHVPSHDAYLRMHKLSVEDPEAFWGEQADSYFWSARWSTPITDYNFDMRKGPIKITWFPGAKTNMCYNALDRHVEGGDGDRVAFFWEGNERGVSRTLTYSQVLEEACRLGNWLRGAGVGEGDDVTIYMPMCPELPVAMLACARIGAVHSVVFAGFSAASLSGRILDSKPGVVITTSGTKRGPKVLHLKKIVDEALDLCAAKGHRVGTVLVHDHASSFARSDAPFTAGRDVWWQDAVPGQSTECPVAWLDSEAPSFKLYTSGSTGTPKAVQHCTGGYMVGAGATWRYIFDYHPGDVYWCTADCGWVTGHSYLVYGPMFNRATQVIFEGVPTYPDAGRFWEIVDKHSVGQFYTAPTTIRALMAKGDEPVTRYSRKSLKLLGTVGEPINPEAWRWYYEVVGDSRCPIIDTYWQTETGAALLSPLPGATPLKPGSAAFPVFGIQPVVLDDKGNELEGEATGVLAIKAPWPSIMRTVSGNHKRFEDTYFSQFKGYYFTGDGCRRDGEGYLWLTGRVDDVINVSGHRIGNAEVESALVTHPKVAEAAVVPVPHDIKGQGIYAFVTLMQGVEYPTDDALKKELIKVVRAEIGPIAAPDAIHWAPGLPKTRSGKIMRRILRLIASHEEGRMGDTSTLADPSVVETLLSMRGV
eukprot:evm.model.scf_2786.1 EVM.evm.TU.scf_2786.1   scf_2786:12831-14819(-)